MIHKIIKKTRDAGSCNFCSTPHKTVNVITGNTYLEVRMCNTCLAELKKQT